MGKPTVPQLPAGRNDKPKRRPSKDRLQAVSAAELATISTAEFAAELATISTAEFAAKFATISTAEFAAKFAAEWAYRPDWPYRSYWTI